MEYSNFMDRLNMIRSSTKSIPTALPETPDYLSAARRKYGVGTPVNTGSSPSVNRGGTMSARASSYWDPQTASGNPMAANTIASPYLPLGTVVEIMKGNKSVKGTVQDFGPADWVMKGDPTRYLDLAEPMMQQLTGQRSNLTGVNYRILKYGKGRVYRPGHSLTEQLRKRWGA